MTSMPITTSNCPYRAARSSYAEATSRRSSGQAWFARRCSDLLLPGGLCVLTTPYHGYIKNLALALTNRFDRHVDPLWDGGHIKFWSRATLGRLLREHGFETIRLRRVGRVPWLAKSILAVFRKPATQRACDRAERVVER